MTYQEIIQRLSSVCGQSEARAVTRLVLEERFGLSLTDIAFGKVSDFSREEAEELEKIIVRLENHEPVQYVLGWQWFCGHRFHVAPGALIPRPETEVLVDECRVRDGGSRILDIGTGSGCVAISLALRHGCRVDAIDISDDALAIARGNAVSLGAEVAFRKADILRWREWYGLGEEGKGRAGCGKYDIIVSNPPYICRKEAAGMERNVLDYEPDTALFVPDSDPLLFYRTIAEFGRESLSCDGMIAFEINRAYGNEVCRMLSDFGYTGTEIIRDQFDNPRIVRCNR
ncbi:MAG: peptide chain release factor N(5)-glutamine methyltransferase [Bacteroidales bacterium]|nr:peptide chain release factor N(5)-glutamine methyltransferase [Bacteroidales bacterium]MCM1146283.1 peptide chain release factor N(5)-glutamine methyltransferase [Bacteroidales bacterium]MCM1205279.1 peptide chain release factor N(5)-glutamine methyltransferase [Bacillota bacterium]MCM1509634.1 peptide chain release factor N(5)-glutamine methyltransferase [Clostridium sp.]